MNIAKKSTTKDGINNKNLNNATEKVRSSAEAIYILDDSENRNSVATSNGVCIGSSAEKMVSNMTSDNTDDVIICDIELPRLESSKDAGINGIHPPKNNTLSQVASSRLSEGLKRSSDSVAENGNKKLKTNSSYSNLQSYPAHQAGSKVVLIGSEELELLIQSTFKQEIVNLKLKFSEEIYDLKRQLIFWEQTANKLKLEITQFKTQEKVPNSTSTLSNLPQVKDSPCNLPPASANPLTSQHLKILHNSITTLNQPIHNITQPQLNQLIGLKKTNIIPLQNPATAIQPKPPIYQPIRPSGVIDLTDEDDVSRPQIAVNGKEVQNDIRNTVSSTISLVPLSREIVKNIPKPTVSSIPRPPSPTHFQAAPTSAKELPSKPVLNLKVAEDGIVLTWDCVANPNNEDPTSFQLFSYQSLKDVPEKYLWKRVGTITAMPLPMVCTLEKSKLDRQAAFAIRAVDQHCRMGPFSHAVMLNKESIT